MTAAESNERIDLARPADCQGCPVIAAFDMNLAQMDAAAERCRAKLAEAPTTSIREMHMLDVIAARTRIDRITNEKAEFLLGCLRCTGPTDDGKCPRQVAMSDYDRQELHLRIWGI